MKTFDKPEGVSDGLMSIQPVKVEVTVKLSYEFNQTPVISTTTVQRYISMEELQDSRAYHSDHGMLSEIAASVLGDTCAKESKK